MQHGEGASGRSDQTEQSHSPLSDPVVLANRRKAAQKEKVAESATFRQSTDAKER
jgi:hypothetical protein